MRRWFFVLTLATVLGGSSLSWANLFDNGNGLIYDSATNLTWYQGPNGLDWSDANSWAQNLDVGGVTGWRLPSYPQTPNYSFDPSGATDVGEMGTLWADSLGNTPGSPFTYSGPFDTTLWSTTNYWTSDMYYNHLSTLAVDYSMYNGELGGGWFGITATEFAVHEGDIGGSGPVPEPCAMLLLGSGLAGLAALREKFRA
jgi:hypothetical protein